MPEPAAAGSMRIASVARNGFSGACSISSAVPARTGPFHADRRGAAEVGPQPVLGGQGGLDHLLLHLAVERDVDFLADVILADVDERVLLGELGQRGVQPHLVARVAGHDGGLQRRRREVRLARAAGPDANAVGADHVADMDARQAGEPGDLAGGHRVAAYRGAVGEDADRGHLAVTAAPEGHPVTDRDAAGEHAGIGDLVAAGPAVNLENPAGDRPAVVAARRGQQAGEPVQQGVDARARDG